jgi:hypothetical protein
MPKRKLLAVSLLASLLSPAFAPAGEVEYVRENGVDYRVTRRTVKRPVSETQIIEKEQDVYREQYITEMRDNTRFVTVPVTEYRWEAEWRNRWNPFGLHYLVHRLVPRTTWETRTEIVQAPITKREMVLEKRVVQVPVTQRRMEEVQIEEKVALSPLSTRGDSAVARREAIGGVDKLNSDPPKSGAGTLSTRR